MKTTVSTIVSLALFGVCASGLLGQQMRTNSPVGQYVAYDDVSAYGAQANRAISSELSDGGRLLFVSVRLQRLRRGDCNHCCANKCCYGCCLHRTGAYAEWLYLSPRNVDLSYAIPQDGIGGVGTVPMGDVGILDLEYETGLRIGFNLAIDCCSSIDVSWTWFDTDDDDAISVDAPNVIQPLTTFPGTFNAGFTAQAAAAAYDVEYQLVDVDYKAVLWSCKGAHVNYVTGFRYAHYESGFAAVLSLRPAGRHDVRGHRH